LNHVDAIKIFEHCRLILGMVLSLGVARLLNGVAKFVQHPKKVKIFPVHLLWVFAIMLHLILFWWWEFRLVYVSEWSFEEYLLLICYALDIFLLCSLLFPDDISDYSGYEHYFMSRRRWFFGIFGFSFLIDFFDTAVKGATYFHSLGWEYPVRNILCIALSIVAMFVSNKKAQMSFGIVFLVYEISSIARLYHTMH
jgi:hypothetical protein